MLRRAGLRYDLYDLFIEFPTPLVPRDLRVPIPERTDWAARSGARRRHAVEAARGWSPRAWSRSRSASSIASPSGAKGARWRRGAGGGARGCRQPVLARAAGVGEYGRASTLANAYVQPIMRYLAARARVREDGYRGPLQIMTSNGGTMPADRSRELPVRLIESGRLRASTRPWRTDAGSGAQLDRVRHGRDDGQGHLIQDGRPLWTTCSRRRGSAASARQRSPDPFRRST